MSLTTKNSGKPWINADVNNLKILSSHNTPTRVIGIKIGRTPDAIYTEASKLGISLSPTNQAPYNKRKKQ